MALRGAWSLRYPAAALIVIGTIGALKLFPGLSDTSVALLLLLAVFLSAWAFELGPGVLAAILATAGFNFFFLPPRYTFTVEDPSNVTALVVFLASALLIGRLSAVGRRRLRQVDAEHKDLATLTALSQGFLADTSREELFGVAAGRLRDALQCERISIWLAGEGGELAEVTGASLEGIRRDLAELAYRQGNSAAFPSALGGVDIYLPIPIGVQRIGTVAALGLRGSERMAEACAALLGLALERERFVRVAREAEVTRSSEEMKSTLLAALAHDLKTPVATARAAVENLDARGSGTEETRLAREQLLALSQRIDDLMQIVRLDSGVAQPRRERVDCSQIVEAALSRFGEALAAHQVFVDVPAQEIAVDVDPSQLTEALGHGLENAARYSPSGSEIRVSVAGDSEHAYLRVSDRGIGVAPEDRDRVFDRFIRLPEAQGVPGTGLGLSISRSLVEMNGGRLRLDRAEPAGTLFEIALPRAA